MLHHLYCTLTSPPGAASPQCYLLQLLTADASREAAATACDEPPPPTPALVRAACTRDMPMLCARTRFIDVHGCWREVEQLRVSPEEEGAVGMLPKAVFDALQHAKQLVALAMQKTFDARSDEPRRNSTVEPRRSSRWDRVTILVRAGSQRTCLKRWARCERGEVALSGAVAREERLARGRLPRRRVSAPRRRARAGSPRLSGARAVRAG